MGTINYDFFKRGERVKCMVCGKEGRIEEERYLELGGKWICDECAKSSPSRAKG